MNKTTITFEIPVELKKKLDDKINDISNKTMVPLTLKAQLIMLIKDFTEN